jgi:hypothetical protein
METETVNLIAAAVVLVIGLLGVLFVSYGSLSRRRDDRSVVVDPIAEADVYLAYGRRKQAISILEEASRANPSDERIRKRLHDVAAGK